MNFKTGLMSRYARKLTKLHKNVYVCTGPLYLPRREEDGKMYVKYEVNKQAVWINLLYTNDFTVWNKKKL